MSESGINRSIRPVIREDSALTWDWPRIVSPMAGPKIVLLEQGHEPLLRIDIQWNHGSWFESDFLAARTMTRMLTEGTLRRSAAEWTSMVDFWGGSIRFSTEAEQTTATLMVLDRFFPQVWPLFLEAITEPAFGQDALDAVLLSKIQHWHIESRKMSFMAGRQLRQMIYPLGHPEARLSHPDIYRAVTRDHLVRAHRQIMENAEISIAVCGPMGAGIIPGLIEDVQRAFPILSSGNLPKAPMLMDLPIPAPALVHVPQQDALQVSLRAALVWPPKTDREYHLLKILVTVLGGYFGSRLMQNLREDLGLTYGVGARLRSYRNHSLMVVQSELSAGSEKLALEQIRFEMDRLGRELISVPEWGRVQSYLRGQLMAGLDGSFALMDRYWDLESFGLGEDYLKDYLRILDETTPEDLMDLAGKYLLPDQLVVASAGPEA